MRSNLKYPQLVVCDESGNIFEIPDIYMSGMELSVPLLPGEDALIQFPTGSDLFVLPGRIPIGYDARKQKFIEVREYDGKPVFAVAAFMAPAYVQIYRAAYKTLSDAPRLPLYSYTAVGWYDNDFCVAGKRIDADKRHDPEQFKLGIVNKKAQQMLKRYSKNRVVHHLVENCIKKYRCPNAQNFVLERWECPVPVSVSCNAGCAGCISSQPSDSEIPSSQDRLTFTPSVEEIIEYTVPHLEKAPNALISFGQGCEGEPLLAGDLIEESIRAIRKRTKRGVININTNGSLPDVVERLCVSGLDSIRISMNSAQENLYNAYHNPKNYKFEDIIQTLKIVRRFNRWSSLNYFIFPGLTDHPFEISSLEKIIEETKINLIQTRNLNIDPEWYIDILKLQDISTDFIGITSWISYLKKKYPRIKLGYFNPYELSM